MVKRLSDELAGLLVSRDSTELLARHGATPASGRSDDFGNLIQMKVPRWCRLIQEARITAD